MNKLLSNSIEDQLEHSFRTCLSMTGVHLIFLIRDYTSSSESASASKCTRWAFRDVSNPSGTPLQSDNAMVVVGTRHNNPTEQLILLSFFPFFLPKQRGTRGREGRRSESFLTEERIEFRFGSPAMVRDAVSYFTLNINIAATRVIYVLRTVYYEKYISQILKTGAKERCDIPRIKYVYVNISWTNDSQDRCSPASLPKTSETDPMIEQVYNGFCRGGNDCNHHSSLGKWKFGSPTLPLFNTVDSNDCPWTEEVDERGKIGGPAKRLKEIKREKELRKNVLRDRVDEGKKYLLNYYRLLAETRCSKCHGDRVEKSVVKEDIVTVGRSCDLRCVMRRRLMSVAMNKINAIPTNNDIPRPDYLSGFDKFATNYEPESWSCRSMSYRLTYIRLEIYPRILADPNQNHVWLNRTTMPNAYNGVAKYCETKARLTFVSLKMTFFSKHYNVAKRHAIFSERKSRLTDAKNATSHTSRTFTLLLTSLNLIARMIAIVALVYNIQRSNTFAADLRVSVTSAVLRDNSIKVMPDMAKGER
ncbi:hypothetical protein ALC53_06312 [Atta colombica]|uniref:Uncharacterized protein n=1 Tax=Atta colombica TaxID=520822 RepID=A0A195BFT8_9HYME|nr:hypothetical protein ALC53_06312 [Atta colombica]